MMPSSTDTLLQPRFRLDIIIAELDRNLPFAWTATRTDAERIAAKFPNFSFKITRLKEKPEIRNPLFIDPTRPKPDE